MTKARACKGAGQKKMSGVTSHVLGSAKMNSHFGSWSPNGFSKLQKAIARAKTHGIEEFLIPLKNK
jgi:hypothetical protein